MAIPTLPPYAIIHFLHPRKRQKEIATGKA
jgi:hypothetical protein